MKRNFGQRRRFFALKLLLFAAMISVLLVSATFVYARIRKTVRLFARSEVEYITNVAVHNAVLNAAANGTDYAELVNITRDINGKISSLTLNSGKVNELKSDIALEVLDNIESRSESLIGIPLGNFTNFDLLSGIGPKIKVKVMPNSIADVDFESQFTQAGINQVLHRINVKITVNVTAYLPNYTDSTDISTSAIVTEAVIVGDVPETYLNLGGK